MLGLNIYWVYLGIILFCVFCLWNVLLNPTEKLYQAVDTGHLDAVKDLMAKGIDPDLCHSGRATSLYLAALNGDLDIVKVLIEHGADVNIGLNENSGMNPLLGATIHDHTEIVGFLIRKGAKAGLHYCAFWGDNKQVESFLAQGNSIHSTRNRGFSPLHLAVLNNQKSTVELLLEHGADINICNPAVESPLHKAVEKENLEMIDFLIEKGANMNSEGLRGTPLKLAVGLNKLSTVQYLIEKGAAVNYQINSFMLPLHVAAWEGYVEIAKVLLDNGAEVDLCSSTNDDTPLHMAASRGNIEVVKLLIEYGANVKSQSLSGTPLEAAHRYPEISLLLISHGA